METDPMKLPWWKVAAAGGFVCAATIGIIELRRSTSSCAMDADAPVIAFEGDTAQAAPWKPATELDDETAGIDPDAMLPARLQLVGHAKADVEFAAAPVPQTKADGPAAVQPELKNPTREELLLHVARNARKRKEYDESAKFYRRSMELLPGRPEIHYEYAELLAEAGKHEELKAFLAKIERETPPKDDAAKQRLAALKDQEQPKAKDPPAPPTSTAPMQPTAPAPPMGTAPVLTQPTPPAPPNQVGKSPPPLKTVEGPTAASTTPAPPAPNRIVAPKKNSESTETPQAFHPPTMQDFERVIAADPNNPQAKLGLARLKLGAWRCSEAGDLLAEASPQLANDREYRLTVAWRHAILGEYHDARCLLQRLRDEAPGDSCCTLAIADLCFLANDHHRTLGEYGKICEGCEESSDALLGAAHALMELRRYEDAFLVCNRRLAIDPNSPEALILLTESLRRMGKIDEAIGRCKRLLTTLPEDHPAVTPMRLQYAKLLVHQGRTAEARTEFETLALTSYGNHPIVVWGLWAFPGKGDNKPRPPAPPVPPEDANFAVVVSEFFVELGKPLDAVNLLEQASASAPSEVLLLNRLGDARSQLRIGTGRYSAMDAYMRALTLSPNNVHALLGYAKAARHAGMWTEALEATDRTIQLDSLDIQARLEKARSLYAMRRFADADAVYAQAAGAPAAEQLRRELGRIAENMPPEQQQVLMPALTADSNNVRELVNVAAQQNEGMREELTRIGADYDAVNTMRGSFSQERAVKAYTDWSPIRGIDAGMKRLGTQPLDDESAFDLGRNYSTLHSTREAEKFYRKVLDTSPNHYAAGVAADRLDLEHGPKATAEGTYFRQRGRKGLTDIDRLRTQAWFSVNMGDEDEYVAVGAGWIRLDPRDDAELDGNVASVRAQFKPFDLLLLHAQLNGESYDDRIEDRLTYDIGATWRASDCLKVYGTLYSNNVVENGETLRQDIYREGLTAGGEYTFNRGDDLGAWYRYANYSDDNELHEFDVFYSHRFCLWPDELKAIADYHYWAYDEGTIPPVVAPPLGGPVLLGTVHPYFAPNGYGLVSAHLEWTKALCGDTFKEADLTWIGIRGGGGVDTDGVGFVFGRAIFHRDLCYWLSFHTELGATESKVYRDLSAYAYLTARLRKFTKTCWATAPAR
jgi:tetratricopeptide (TPR) repeat protein